MLYSEEGVKMKAEKKSTRVLKIIMAAAPFVMMAVCAVLYITVFRNITAEQLLKYTPENIWLASLVIIGMFSLKSLSFFFPMFVIVAVCGKIAPNLLVAVIINGIGTFCMMNLPYFIGRFAEREFVQGLLKKNRKIEQLHDIHMDNEVFLVFFLRAINILPYDVVSLFLGSTNISWKKYIAGSVLGTYPGMVLASIMGSNADDPLSAGFIIPAALEVLMGIASAIWYFIYIRRKTKGN